MQATLNDTQPATATPESLSMREKYAAWRVATRAKVAKAFTRKQPRKASNRTDTAVHYLLQAALWGGFAFFLLASLPHVAYFFSDFERGTDQATFFGWLVTYGPALAIDLAAFLLSFVLARRLHHATTGLPWYLRPMAALPSLILLLPFVLLLAGFSWFVNWQHALQFHDSLLSVPEALNMQIDLIIWHGTIAEFNPILASAFPVLAIAYTAMADHVRNEESGEPTREAPTQASVTIAPAPAPQIPAPAPVQPAIDLTQLTESVTENVVRRLEPQLAAMTALVERVSVRLDSVDQQQALPEPEAQPALPESDGAQEEDEDGQNAQDVQGVQADNVQGAENLESIFQPIFVGHFTSKEEAVKAAIAQHPGASDEEIARLATCTVRTVRRWRTA